MVTPTSGSTRDHSHFRLYRWSLPLQALQVITPTSGSTDGHSYFRLYTGGHSHFRLYRWSLPLQALQVVTPTSGSTGGHSPFHSQVAGETKPGGSHFSGKWGWERDYSRFGMMGETEEYFDPRSEELPLETHHCSIPRGHRDHLKHLLPVSTVSFTQRGRI